MVFFIKTQQKKLTKNHKGVNILFLSLLQVKNSKASYASRIKERS
jgi:hypothetical protein